MRTWAGAGMIALAVLAAPASPALAQSPVGRAVTAVGVSFLRSGDATALGFMVDTAKNFAVGESVGIGPVGDFGFYRHEDFTITSFFGGGRVTIGRGPVQVFGQTLVGYERCCGVSDFAWQPGGGLDIRVNAMLNIRSQMDLRIIRPGDGDGAQTFRDLRLSFGVSMPFGK